MLWDSITDDWISRFVSSKDAAVHYLRGKKRGGGGGGEWRGRE